MSTHSTDGREWAQLSKLKSGDKLELDGGFTCVAGGSVVTVDESAAGMFFKCASGRHHLDGQLSEIDDDHLVGCWPA